MIFLRNSEQCSIKFLIYQELSRVKNDEKQALSLTADQTAVTILHYLKRL